MLHNFSVKRPPCEILLSHWIWWRAERIWELHKRNSKEKRLIVSWNLAWLFNLLVRTVSVSYFEKDEQWTRYQATPEPQHLNIYNNKLGSKLRLFALLSLHCAFCRRHHFKRYNNTAPATAPSLKKDFEERKKRKKKGHLTPALAPRSSGSASLSTALSDRRVITVSHSSWDHVDVTSG